jgi:hypothetical protein
VSISVVGFGNDGEELNRVSGNTIQLCPVSTVLAQSPLCRPIQLCPVCIHSIPPTQQHWCSQPNHKTTDSLWRHRLPIALYEFPMVFRNFIVCL